MAYRYGGWAVAWQRPSGAMGISSRIWASKSKAEGELAREQAEIDNDNALNAGTDRSRFYPGERMMLVYVEAKS